MVEITRVETEGFVVVCHDGEIRHDDNFVTESDAETFAEWGHACTNRHTIAEILLAS